MIRITAAAVVLAAATVAGAGTVAGAATLDHALAGGRSGPGPAAGATATPAPGSGWMGGRGTGRGNGRGMGGPASGASQYDVPAAIPGATISQDVAAKLQYLVAEEKLARDVYKLAASLYGDRVFTNISSSESKHMAEVQLLLTRYQVEDPTRGDAAGKFDNPDLQALYNKLAAQVKEGRTQAYQAGVTIEETDIADLDKALAVSAPADVTTILNNLRAGSQRHLAAFQRWA